MRDIFYNTIYKVGSIKWKKLLSDSESNEWEWICRNRSLINKHQEEIGLKNNLYLARLLFALLNHYIFEKDYKFISEEELLNFIKIEDEIDKINISKNKLQIEHRILALYHLCLKDNNKLLELGLNKLEVFSNIQYYQKLLDEKSLEKSQSFDIIRVNYENIVLHRSGLVFYQLAKESFKAKISITHLYKLYNQYSFIKYFNLYNTDDWNHKHPIFKIIRKQRRIALNQYESRLKI